MKGDETGKNIILTMGDFFSALGAASPSPELKGILQGDLFKDLAAYFFPGTTTATSNVCSLVSDLSQGTRTSCEAAGCEWYMTEYQLPAAGGTGFGQSIYKCRMLKTGTMYKPRPSAPNGQGVTWFILDIVVKDMISHMLPADVVPRYKVGATCGPKSGCGSAGKNMFQGRMLQELLYQMIPGLTGSGPGSTWSDAKAAGAVMKDNM